MEKACCKTSGCEVRITPAANGTASHLCGSTVMEPAHSIPRTRSRCFREKIVAAPYAPSTCNQRLLLQHTFEISTRSSTTPELVVPAVAMTQKGFRPEE